MSGPLPVALSGLPGRRSAPGRRDSGRGRVVRRWRSQADQAATRVAGARPNRGADPGRVPPVGGVGTAERRAEATAPLATAADLPPDAAARPGASRPFRALPGPGPATVQPEPAEAPLARAIDAAATSVPGPHQAEAPTRADRRRVVRPPVAPIADQPPAMAGRTVTATSAAPRRRTEPIEDQKAGPPARLPTAVRA